MEITPGVRRIGNGMVNCYLVAEGNAVTLIDAGLPGYWDDLIDELGSMGRGIADVRAVVLTHAHADHIGFAERARRERRVPVRVHEADALLAQGKAKTERSMGRISVGPLVRFLLYAFRNGGLSSPFVAEVSAFADGDVLDVPGAPRVIHTPGHTAGSASLLVGDTLFVGDAFVTYEVLSGATGPRMGNFNADTERAYASLARLESSDARIVLPGHGEPWRDGIAQAARLVRERRRG